MNNSTQKHNIPSEQNQANILYLTCDLLLRKQ